MFDQSGFPYFIYLCLFFFYWEFLRLARARRNPFKQEGKHLYLLTTGIVSKYGVDKVNCDQAEHLGELIQERLHGMNFAEVKFSKKDQFKSLSSYTRSVDVTSSDPISLNPTILFTRLATVAERDEDVQRYYKYELTVRPCSIFLN